MAHLLDDPYLKPFEAAIRGRAAHARMRADALTQGQTSLADWANAHNYFGLHRDRRGWVFREWAPHATEMFGWSTRRSKSALYPARGMPWRVSEK